MPNPIGWCDETLNPIVGCNNGCPYCYARRMAHRGLSGCPECKAFTPHFHPERLEQLAHWRKPRRIFMDSMSDLFGKGVDIGWLLAIREAMAAAPQHAYLVLTKRPENIPLWWKPAKNLWLGASITNQADAKKRLDRLACEYMGPTFASIEPMLRPVRIPWRLRVEWFIVGAETGRKNAVVPERGWIQDIIGYCRDTATPVFIKSNIVAHYPEFAGIQEFPEGLRLPAQAGERRGE